MKVLVVRFSSIGDIVLTSPVLRCIKQQIPYVKVHFLTKKAYSSVVEHNPFVDKCFFMEDNLDKVLVELKKEKYDYIVDLHKNLRTYKVRKALKVQSFDYPKLNVQKWILVNFKKNFLPDKSIVERYFEAVSPINVKNDGQGLDYFIPEKDNITNRDIPMSHWAGYIACGIGGTHKTKQFPAHKWRELLSQLKYPVILLGGAEDRETGERIAEIDPIRIYNACGKFNINESAALVRYSRLVATNDTGIMHIAAAFKKSIISLWGNTVPEMGMFPYYGFNNLNRTVSEKSVIGENRTLSCRPCSKIGYDQCPKGHFKCMNDIDNQFLTDKINKFWQYSQP